MEILVILLIVNVIILFILNQNKKKTISNQILTIDQLNSKLSEQNNEIDEKNKIIEKYQPIINIEVEVERFKNESLRLNENLAQLKNYYADYELAVDLEEMSFYQPKFDFGNYLEYADALEIIRETQKEMIKQKEIFDTVPTKNNKDIANLAVNALNNECSNIITSITYNNFERSKEKLLVIFNKINNLLSSLYIQISQDYLELKIKEMALVYDLKEKEQRIKEEQLELKEQMREEEKARVEAEKAREKAIKEQERYEQALEQARIEIELKTGEDRKKYELQIEKLENKLKEALEERERATAMAQITKKGHVYIISNIGSFGENVYKIGMTRRKEPLDRVKELGDASVPFAFDVHALVYTDDAPALENALHKEFETNRMNKVNLRKEFFKVKISEIDEACKKLGYKIRLTQLADAKEFHQTIDIEKQMGNKRN